MRFVKRVFLTIVLLFLSLTPCLAESTELAAVLADLRKSASETHSISSKFVQEKHLSIFSESLESQGMFLYQQPDRLRWELLGPVASGFVLRGEQGERWNGLSKERSAFSVDQDPVMGMVARQLLAWARVDLDWLQQRYRIELLSAEPVRLQLFPRDPGEAGFIESLQILFSADRRHLEEVLLSEQGGDSTRLHFSEVVINGELPADAFAAPEL